MKQTRWKAMSTTFIVATVLLPFSAASGQTPITLHKGTNVFPWLYRARSVDDKGQAYPSDHTFPYASDYTVARLSALRQMGFDFVRIPVEPNPFLAMEVTQRVGLINQVLAAVDVAGEAGLTAIVDFHPRETVPRWQAAMILNSRESRTLYRDILVEVAAALVKYKKRNVVFELMNEPPGGWSAADDLWLPTQKEYLKAVRHVAPDLPIIVTGDKGGGIDGLLRLDPSEVKDVNLYYSFHYYDPMVITHQMATWTTHKYREYISDIVYPPIAADENATLIQTRDNIFNGISDPQEAKTVWRDAEKQLHLYFETKQGRNQIEADFARVTQWAKSNRIPASRILLGEFGVYRPGAATETALLYIEDVRIAAEHAGFAWAVFNYQPTATLPAFSILQLPGSVPANFDPEIVKQGLGLSLPTTPELPPEKR